MPPDAKDLRIISSTKRLDRQAIPPRYVDEELPTTTKLLFPIRRGRVRAPRGTILGSMYLTGSARSPISSPGSFSLRVTRVSVFTGSRNMEWFIRHSRKGTIDVISFQTPGQVAYLGNPLEPVYAMGPGTVIFGWLGDAGGLMGSAYFTGQSLEGVIA